MREGAHQQLPQARSFSTLPSCVAAPVTWMNRELNGCQVGRFRDGEVSVRVLDNVRGQDVYIIQVRRQLHCPRHSGRKVPSPSRPCTVHWPARV